VGFGPGLKNYPRLEKSKCYEVLHSLRIGDFVKENEIVGNSSQMGRKNTYRDWEKTPD
jgi:hypothetical protein